MPTEHRIRFEDKQCVPPVLHAADEKDKPEAIGLRKSRLLDLTVKDNELLTKQGIFGHEVGFAACEVGGRAEYPRMAGRLSEMQESLFKARNATNDPLGKPMKESEHAARLQESCQKLSRECIQRSVGVKFSPNKVFSQHSSLSRGMRGLLPPVGEATWRPS
jgi:hypothetical protein